MSVLEAAIGWLAPPQCINCGSEGFSLCIDCSTTGILPYGERCWGCGAMSDNGRACPKCRRSGSPSRVWITTNHEGLARDLLHAYKFDQQRAAAGSVARLMIETYKSTHDAPVVQGPSSHTATNYLVVPIPTATRRVRERGFDHSALLAKNIALTLGLKHRSVLGRIGQSRQVGTKRAERFAQISDRLWVRKPSLIKDCQILLIDDVVTTGATLNAASRTLRQAGAACVDALIFAKRL